MSGIDDYNITFNYCCMELDNEINNDTSHVNIKFDLKSFLSSFTETTSKLKNIHVVEKNETCEDELLQKINVKTSYEEEISSDTYNYQSKLFLFCEITYGNNLVMPMMDNSDAYTTFNLLYCEETGTIFICVEYSHPNFWYIIKTKNNTHKQIIKEIINIIKFYNPIEYNNDDTELKLIKAFIGTESMINMNINDFMENMLLSEWLELFTWTTNNIDHPFRETLLNEKLSAYQYNKMNITVNQQHDEHTKIVNVCTRYSKTLLSFEILQNGLFIVSIYYRPKKIDRKINGKNKIGQNYDTDLPIDVLQSIIGFPFIKYDEMLQLEPLDIYNFTIANMLAHNDPNKQKVLCKQMKNILNTNNLSENVLQTIKRLMETYKINISINEFYGEINDNKINKNTLKLILKTNLEDLDEKYFNKIEIKNKILTLISKIIEETKCEIVK